MFDMWWIYVLGAGVVAFVLFQAWDRRRNADRAVRLEKGRVDKEGALYPKGSEIRHSDGAH
jgi:hypothetical protein